MKQANQDKYSKLKKCFPSIFTGLNMLMGITVIYLMVLNKTPSSKMYLPCLIIFAGIFDCLDGRLARSYNAESQFGRELDSLADSISFGIAPVTLVVSNLVRYAGIFGIIAAILFPFAGVFRLARFNVSKPKGYFEGLPITAAGVGLALKQLIVLHLKLDGSHLYIDAYITSIIMILASYLMISRIRFVKI